ncbi:MAG TPA: heavy metal-binding domain-containing protein [Myxococcaceae bacterium]|nr:heavy metal-binding domain-containing protein [Myxococcaceae bacterium]
MSGARWPLFARAALLAGALGAAVMAGLALRSQRAGPGADYVCPMHPDVHRLRPGDCPLCGMALVAAVAPGPQRSPAAERSAELPRGTVEVARRRTLGERRAVPAWVDATGKVMALVPEDAVAELEPGASGAFRPGADPDRPSSVRRTAEPAVGWDGELWKASFETARGRPPLHPGQTGWVSLEARPRQALVLPSSAVLRSEKGPYVLVVARGGPGFEARPVRLGEAPDGQATVVSGVEERDRVVVRGAFFLDADLRQPPEAEAAGR